MSGRDQSRRRLPPRSWRQVQPQKRAGDIASQRTGCATGSSSSTLLRVPAPDLLLRLLQAPGPSGFESEPAAIWREAAAEFADEVEVDGMGSSIARVRTAGEEAPLFALFGHVDEIGLIVTHVDDNGILFFRGLGGWTAEVLVGQPSRSSRAEAGFRASSRRNGTCGGARRRRRSRCDTSISTSGLTTATTRLRPCASAIPPCWPRPRFPSSTAG